MAILNHSVTIDAPVDKIWGVLTNLEEVGEYNPLVEKATYTSTNKEGVGSSRECQFKGKGFGKERVTDIQLKKSISMEMVESSWPLKFMRWTNSLSPQGDTVVINTQTEYQFKFGWLGTLLDKLVMKRQFNKILNDLFASMKHYVENKSS